VALIRHQHQTTRHKDRRQPCQCVDRSVLVRCIFGHVLEVQGQRNREGDEDQTGQRSNATTHHDEEAVPQLWLVNVSDHGCTGPLLAHACRSMHRTRSTDTSTPPRSWSVSSSAEPVIDGQTECRAPGYCSRTTAHDASSAARAAVARGCPAYAAKWTTNSPSSSMDISPERSAPPKCASIATVAPVMHAQVMEIQRRSLRVKPGRVQTSAKTWSMTTAAM